MANITTTVQKRRLSVKAQTLAALAAVVGAVALPQILHIAGAALGLGIIPGEVFLPMHLPIILVGLLAGPFAGAAAGIAAPIVSFMLTGMPMAGMVPFMVVELCAYGLLAGMLMNVRLNSVLKVLAVQITGRVFYSLAILIAVYGLGSTLVAPAAAWTGLARGIVGIVIQLVAIPAIVYGVDKLSRK